MIRSGFALFLVFYLQDKTEEFKTAETAQTTTITRKAAAQVGQSGFLGVTLKDDVKGKIVIAEVQADSAAAKAGLQPGDTVVLFDGQAVEDADEFHHLIQAQSPGTAVKLTIDRQGQSMDIAATLGATSRPMKLSTERVVFGAQIGEPREDDGAPITRISQGSPAEKAGLKVGDHILKIDESLMTSTSSLSDSLSEKRPGDTVTVHYRRDGKDAEVKVELALDERSADRSFFRGGSYFKKEVYRLALIGIEYPDQKRHEKIALKDWEEAFFSKGTYTKQNVTGSTVYGSLNDYYQEQSHGKLRVEGKMFDWILVTKNRMDYSPGTGTSSRSRSELFTETLDKLLARDGKDALKDFDGIHFIFAGSSVRTTRGGLYWPHRGSVTHQGKRWAYFICPEGGSRMSSISTACHEFGHMLGLPDLYARPENPGSEGLGRWCAMSNQSGNGRPQHFSAWCKEQLGWIKPVILDPRVKQKLILSPIEDSPKECFKVLIRPDGSEYLLLENRRRKGFDQSLPAEGLLIWRVDGNRPILEESHGVEGAPGPGVYLSSVPYPSAANNSYTPYTTPSSRSQLGGGLPVHITNITRQADGKISFYIGYEYR
jgi:M6 family metalloprotease-like protein